MKTATVPPRPACCEAPVQSPDGLVTVTMVPDRTNEPRTMAAGTTTFAWKDGTTVRHRSVDIEETGVVVEQIGEIHTARGTVYLFIGEMKSDTFEYDLTLQALRIEPGKDRLVPVADFFPPLPGASCDRATLEWSYLRARGNRVSPRPVEARVDPVTSDVRLWILSDATDYPSDAYLLRGAPRSAYAVTLRLEGSKLVAEHLCRKASARLEKCVADDPGCKTDPAPSDHAHDESHPPKPR